MILSEHSIVSDLENDIGKMSNHLHEMDDILLEASKIAKKYDLGSMHYESESYHIDYVTGFLKSIEEYVCGLRYSLSREIENPAAQELTEKVLNPLKSIDLMKITTYNTVGVKERNTLLSENDVYAYREKESLTFADFMGGGDDENSLWENVGYVEGFHELFEADYEHYKEYYTTYDAYLNNTYIWSKDTQMKKQSESDAWDFTVVKPLIEIITGEDMIMHTKLTEEQKKLKAMGIFVDVSMFLFSFATGGESLTAGSLVKALMVEMVTGMSTVGVTRFANAYNLSPGVTMLLMFLVGTFTGVAANSAFDFIEDGVDDWARGFAKNNIDDGVGILNDETIKQWVDFDDIVSSNSFALGGRDQRNYEIPYSREKIIEFIKRGTATEHPIFAEDTADNCFASYVRRVKPEEGFYDVALHGTPVSAEFFGEPIDAYTLAKIVRNRDDYKSALKSNPDLQIRLLSCSTGDTTDTGDCFAQILANQLDIKVKAPTEKIFVDQYGRITIGKRNTGFMKLFCPRGR